MKKIIIIEDDAIAQNTYKNILIEAGYEVMIVPTAKEGLTLIRQQMPDLVILDIMLPEGMNGFDVLEILKKDPELSKIIVLVITNLETEAKIAKEIGAADYFVKANLSIDDIVAKVKKYLPV